MTSPRQSCTAAGATVDGDQWAGSSLLDGRRTGQPVSAMGSNAQQYLRIDRLSSCGH